MRHSNAALVREWSCTQFWERNSPKNGLSCCIICSKIHSFTCAVSRTQYARCLKINDASIYRIQSMIESGDKYNSNPLGCMYSCMCVCVPTSPHERPQPHVRVCLSHLSFHWYTYRQHFTTHSFSIRLSSSVLRREIHNQFHFIFASPPACVYFYFLFWFWVSFVFIFERNFTMKITTQKALKGNKD